MSCARCGDPHAPVLAYFGPDLCSPCAQAAADYFDQAGRWPPLPADWQAELDALGPRRAQLDALGPEPWPADVNPTEDHLWVPCSVCGCGCLIALQTPAGHKRAWPSCRMTPGCPGVHHPHHDQQEKAS
jgi:hypothetical protein